MCNATKLAHRTGGDRSDYKWRPLAPYLELILSRERALPLIIKLLSVCVCPPDGAGGSFSIWC
jgi:hypothetical protein